MQWKRIGKWLRNWSDWRRRVQVLWCFGGRGYMSGTDEKKR